VFLDRLSCHGHLTSIEVIAEEIKPSLNSANKGFTRGFLHLQAVKHLIDGFDSPA